MRTQGSRRLVMLVVAAVAAIGPLGDAAQAAPRDEADFVQVFTQDVYERVGANLVNPDAGSDPNAALFNVNDVALATAPGDPVTSAPDRSSFVAGSSGEAEFHGRVDGDLLAASQVLFSIIYHADGQTYYPLPNRGEFVTQGTGCGSSFGLDAMRQVQIGQKW